VYYITDDFNDHALRRTVDKIKGALDPNGILALGKQGQSTNDYSTLYLDADHD
jgi:4-cresol dehydrogenase (hydroxylating)